MQNPLGDGILVQVLAFVVLARICSLTLMLDSERKFVDLLFRASKKYANWDPEVVVEVGDWGRITTGKTGLAFWRRGRGTFLKEGNIYKDGKAEKYGIPPPKELGLGSTEGVTWIVSQNLQECDVNAAVGGCVTMVSFTSNTLNQAL
jgi:hypothetical protein